MKNIDKCLWLDSLSGVSFVLFGVLVTLLSVVFQLGRVLCSSPSSGVVWLEKWVVVPLSLVGLVVVVAEPFTRAFAWWNNGPRRRIVAELLGEYGAKIILILWASFHFGSFAATGGDYFPEVARVPGWAGMWFMISLWLIVLLLPVVALLELVSRDGFEEICECYRADWEFGITRLVCFIGGFFGAVSLVLWHFASGEHFTAEFPGYPPLFNRIFSVLMTAIVSCAVVFGLSRLCYRLIDANLLRDASENDAYLLDRVVHGFQVWYRRAFFALALFWGLATIPCHTWVGRTVIIALLAVALLVVLLKDQWFAVVFRRPVLWLGVPMFVLYLVAPKIRSEGITVAFQGISEVHCQDFAMWVWGLLFFGSAFLLKYKQPLIPNYDSESQSNKSANTTWAASWIFGATAAVYFLGLCLWTETGANGNFPIMVGQYLIVQAGFTLASFLFLILSAAALVGGVAKVFETVFPAVAVHLWIKVFPAF